MCQTYGQSRTYQVKTGNGIKLTHSGNYDSSYWVYPHNPQTDSLIKAGMIICVVPIYVPCYKENSVYNPANKKCIELDSSNNVTDSGGINIKPCYYYLPVRNKDSIFKSRRKPTQIMVDGVLIRNNTTVNEKQIECKDWGTGNNGTLKKVKLVDTCK